MNEAEVVVDNCTKYEQNQSILLQDITTNTQCMMACHNYSNVAGPNAELHVSATYGT